MSGSPKPNVEVQSAAPLNHIRSHCSLSWLHQKRSAKYLFLFWHQNSRHEKWPNTEYTSRLKTYIGLGTCIIAPLVWQFFPTVHKISNVNPKCICFTRQPKAQRGIFVARVSVCRCTPGQTKPALVISHRHLFLCWVCFKHQKIIYRHHIWN